MPNLVVLAAALAAARAACRWRSPRGRSGSVESCSAATIDLRTPAPANVSFAPHDSILCGQPIGLIHGRQVSGGYWVVVAVWGEQGSFDSRTYSGARGAQTDHRLLYLDAFEWLYKKSIETTGPSAVHAESNWLKVQVWQQRDSFPGLFMCLAYAPEFDDHLLHAEELIKSWRVDDSLQSGGHGTPLRASELGKKTLYVGTDASASAGYRGVGIAFLTAEGVWQQSILRKSDDVLLGEIRAIELALGALHRRNVLVYCDSRHAIAAINEPERVVSSVRRAAAYRVRELMIERSVTLEWVRSHSGHPLNEGADRLALHARRCFQNGIEPSEQPETIRWIIADVLR